MTNYRLITGPFEGEVIEEGSIKDKELAKERYENSWQSEETNDPVTLKPLSEW